MTPLPAFLMTLAAIAAVVGCSPPNVRAELSPPDPAVIDAGTPAASVAAKREVRYYVDETGAVWDDRGKRHESMP